MTFQQWLMHAQWDFPHINGSNCRPTSPADDSYNCIAWAVEDSENWWWPDPLGQQFWPMVVPRLETLDAFVRAYALHGYTDRSDESLDPGLQKIAIFAAGSKPTHSARQLRNGWWTSKLGEDIDIEHELRAVEGPLYGEVCLILSKRSEE